MQLRFIFPPHRPGAAWLAEGDSRPLVAEIQQVLAANGFYRGAAHGVFDAATYEAVSLFQESAGLKPTGGLDPITYCLLLPAAKALTVEPTAMARVKTGLPRANILITKSARTLALFDGNSPLRQYPVALGKPATPTPEGNFAIASKIMNPGGVLGSRWLGLNFDTYGIHGTNAPWKIGQLVSNGCIRMHNAHVEELFHLVSIGTPVFIRN
mgnify:CR=1 FL=1